jgi:predicted TPR repeat methyltransferase
MKDGEAYSIVKGSAMGDKPDPAAKELLARAYDLHDEAETKALYRDWAETYDDTMMDGLGYLTPARTAALLAEHLDDRQTAMLDIGCGTGLAGAELARLGFTVIDALDYSAEMLAVAARRNVYRDFFEADLNRPLDIAASSYGALISTGTFTHAHVGADCLDELFRILQPGGLFACTVHKDVWVPAGFAAKAEALNGAGTLETLSSQPGPYFADSAEPDGYFILWRRAY